MASFLTINVNGLRDHNKRLSFLHWLSHVAVDFVCLQETHVSSCSECDSWFSPYGFLAVSSPGTTRSCGSVILYRPTFILSKVAFDNEGRFVLAHFKRNDVVFGVACIYAPNRNPERNDFFAYCADQIDPAVPSVVCGDFNVAFDRSLDRRGTNVSDTSHESSLALRDLFHDCCVIYIWRSLHPSTVAFTWLKPDATLSSRIDLIGCPHSWLHHVDCCNILSCPFSHPLLSSSRFIFRSQSLVVLAGGSLMYPFLPMLILFFLSKIFGLLGDLRRAPLIPFSPGGTVVKKESRALP